MMVELLMNSHKVQRYREIEWRTIHASFYDNLSDVLKVINGLHCICII